MMPTRSRCDIGPPFPAALAGLSAASPDPAPSVAKPTAPLRASRRVSDAFDKGSLKRRSMAGIPGVPEPSRPRTGSNDGNDAFRLDSTAHCTVPTERSDESSVMELAPDRGFPPFLPLPSNAAVPLEKPQFAELLPARNAQIAVNGLVLVLNANAQPQWS